MHMDPLTLLSNLFWKNRVTTIRVVLLKTSLVAFAALFCISSLSIVPEIRVLRSKRYDLEFSSRITDIGMDIENPWNRSDCLSKMVRSSEGAMSQPNSGELFCFVITSSKYHNVRVPAVHQTWLPRCDRGQFYTNTDMSDEEIPFSTVFAGLPDRYEYLFYKTLYALHYTFHHISKDFDWYFKADDDTYVIVEHLKEYLSTMDPSKPYYIGYRMRPYLENGYNSGGSGYVLSREALRLFDEKLFKNTTLCPDNKYEDAGIGRCFASIGVYPIDSRNERGQQRFNAYRHDDVFGGKVTNDWIFDPQILGFDSIGEDLISLHHISPSEMRLFDQLLYYVKSPKPDSKPRRGDERIEGKYIF